MLGALSIAFRFLFFPILRLVLVFNKFLRIGSLLGFLGRFFVSFGRTAVGIILWVGRAMLANPILLAIAVIIGAIYLLWKNWDLVVKKVSEAWQWVCKKFDENPILNILFPIVPILRLIMYLFDNWGDITNNLKQKWDELSNKAGQIWTSIKNWISDVLSPLDNVKSGIQWLIDNLSKISWDGIKQGAIDVGNKVKNYASEKVDVVKNYVGEKWDNFQVWAGLKNRWSGGYTGNGGKYEPKGIVHGGEYVMTKEATSRLGISTLNALNYGKNALLATGLGVSVAAAQPFTMDNRAPLNAHNQPQVSQPMHVNITIHTQSNQSANDIAREVQRQLLALEQRRQAKARSKLADWD